MNDRHRILGVGEVDRIENGADEDESLGTGRAFHEKKGPTPLALCPSELEKGLGMSALDSVGVRGLRRAGSWNQEKPRSIKGRDAREEGQCGSLPIWGFLHKCIRAERT